MDEGTSSSAAALVDAHGRRKIQLFGPCGTGVCGATKVQAQSSQHQRRRHTYVRRRYHALTAVRIIRTRRRARQLARSSLARRHRDFAWSSSQCDSCVCFHQRRWGHATVTNNEPLTPGYKYGLPKRLSPAVAAASAEPPAARGPGSAQMDGGGGRPSVRSLTLARAHNGSVGFWAMA